MSARTRVVRSLLVLACGALLSTSCGGKSVPESAAGVASAAGPLLGSISSAIPGLSQAQAILGAGSMLGLAKAKMPGDQFNQVADAIPGSKDLLNSAIASGLPKSLSGIGDVTSFLGKSGISADQVNQLGGVLSTAGGSKVPAGVASAWAAGFE